MEDADRNYMKRRLIYHLTATIELLLLSQLFYNIQQTLHDIFIRWLEKLGTIIARKWLYFIIVPVAFGCLASLGLRNIEFYDEFETLYLPIRGRWNKEKQIVDQYFPSNRQHNFDPSRSTTLGQYINIIIQSRVDGGNILADHTWSNIKTLDRLVSNKNISFHNETYTFYDICAEWRESCFFPLYPIRPDLLSKLEKIIFEFKIFDDQYFKSFGNFSFELTLGGQKFQENGILKSAEAISLFYWLRSEYDADVKKARLWEKEIMNLLETVDLPYIKINYFAARTPGDEMEIANEKMKPLLAVSGVLMVIFAASSSLMKDIKRSKVIVSLGGIFSVVLATGSAFGILIIFQVPFIGINYAVIFLMLGIGLDDMFVFLASWRMTSIHDTLEKRMEATYRHSCVSVTVTSLTNIVAFSIGTYTKIRTIQIFSYYAFFSSLFTYVYFITFFGGILAASGEFENWCWRSRLSKSISNKVWQKETAIMQLDCHLVSSRESQTHYGMLFIRDFFGHIAERSYARVIVGVTYFIYIIIIIIGIGKLEQEKRPDRVSFRESTTDYFRSYDKYFCYKPSYAQVILTGIDNYNDQMVKEKIMKLHDSLECLPFVKEKWTVSFIRHLYRRIGNNSLNEILSSNSLLRKLIPNSQENSANKALLNCFDMSNVLKNISVDDLLSGFNLEKVFSFITSFSCNARQIFSKIMPGQNLMRSQELLESLKVLSWLNHYLRQGRNAFEMDIALNKNLHKIDAARFLILVDNASEAEVQISLRKIVDSSGLSSTYIFNYPGFLNDQVDLVRSTTVISVIITTLIVLIISLIFIPSFICSLWIAFTIISVELGVISLMALWGEKLNAVSMVNLIMCVGFSVDFSAHFTYAYYCADGLTQKEWTRSALYNVGLPILFGGISTIVGIIPICFSNANVFITFSKIVSLVISLGMVHALIYLPLFMSFLSPKKLKKYKINKVKDIVENKDITVISTLYEKNHIIQISRGPSSTKITIPKTYMLSNQPILTNFKNKSEKVREGIAEEYI